MSDGSVRSTHIELSIKAKTEILDKANKQMDAVVDNAKNAGKSISGMEKGLKETNKTASDTNKTFKVANKGIVTFSRNSTTAGKYVGNLSKELKQTNTVTDSVTKKFKSANGQVLSFSRNLNKSGNTVSKTTGYIGRLGERTKNSMDSMTKSTGLFGRMWTGTKNTFIRGMSDMSSNTRKSTSGITGAFRGITPTVNRVTSNIASGVSRGITTPFREATGVVKGYASALGVLSGGALAATGIGRLSAIENAQTSLTVMMGDAKKAKRFLDDVLAFAKTTPFAFPDLAETARNLIAFGMDSKKVVPTLKAIGDAAAGTGKGAEGLRQVASAFGDMQTSGNISMDQINRLSDAGVPAIKILANQAGISTDAMKKSISDGAVSSAKAIDVLVKGMQKGTDGIAGKTAAMAGIMEKTKDNWTGSVDSLKSSISSTMAKIMEPAKPRIQAGMRWFGDQFSKLPGVINATTKFFKPFTSQLSGMAEPIKNTTKLVYGVIRMFSKDMGDGYMKGVDIVSQILPEKQAQNVIKTVDKIKGVFGGFFNSAKNAKNVISGVFNLFKGDDTKAYVDLHSILPKSTMVNIANGVEKIKSVFGNLKSTVKSLIPFFITIGTSFMSVVDFIAPYIGKALGGIVGFVKSITGQIAGFWQENGGQITEAVRNIGTVLGAVFKVLMPVIGVIVRSVWGNIKGVIVGAINVILGVTKIFTGLLTGDFSKMWEGIKQLFFGAIQFIWNGINLLFIGRILGGIRALGSKSIGFVREMWGGIKNFFTGGATNIWGIVNNLTGKVTSGFNFLKQKAVDVALKMMIKMQTIFGDIVAGAKALPGKMGEGIKSMAKGAWKGIKYLGNTMLSGIGKVVNGVIKGLNWVMGKIGLDLVINEWDVPQYAKGTKGHPGGPAILGDGGGPELFRTPSGFVGMSPGTDTLMNLPKGTQVIPHKQTQELINMGMPAYGLGNVIGDKFKAGASWLKDVGVSAWEGTKKVASKVKDVALDVFDYIGHPSKLLNKVLEKFGVSFPSMSGFFGDIGKGAFSFVKGKAVDFLKSKLSGFMSGGGSADVKKWVAQAIGIAGVPASWAGPLQTIAMKESGGNPRAVNNWDSNAKRGTPSQGLMQTIGPTFNAYKFPGHNNIFNPVDNILAAIGYIKSRYGNVFNVPGIKAMAAGGAYRGYAKGTKRPLPHAQTAWVGENGPELVRLPAGAQVFNNRTSEGIEKGEYTYTPNAQSSSRGGIVFSPVIHVKVEGGQSSTETNVEKAVKKALEEAMKDLRGLFDPGVAY
ncbi:tape measure protein [Heyndrickxia sporothermodurans]|uniref:tape measure protein n=1 Tax=Heyndrickxia sporothermodurans TaxID=46224 RepID=UPI002E1EB01D|nr:tape measure protein [Heyndrickxia sporothermodurans]